ncbi:hypothetical protein AJ80_02759 [Polytolypa hystricis UAMH7299]|uniref:Thioredoxin-like fold domain-containing protein n=1 Tax=Polytolypa hystricis (strain UAMH7299) TaxID=1447883 RepID=A0A2B7YQ17_POLH7|nr:hypothetical protein AJ80_02759 [Polytolypa hystricis UAMH7299]
MSSTTKPQPTITLYRGFPGSSTYTWSPFVTKLETRLRLANLSYKCQAGSIPNAPRGKVPYVAISQPDDSIKGEKQEEPVVIADSTLIVEKLVKDEVIEEELNEGLDPVEEARDLAVRALLEDKLNFYQIHEKWIKNYYTMRSKVLDSIPWPIQIIVGLIIHRGVVKTLHGQGTGRFTDAEISVFKREVWESVNALLVAAKRGGGTTSVEEGGEGEEPFWVLGGKGPSEADTTVFGFVASTLVCASAPESQQIIRSFPVVLDYARRIHARYFPDYECWE